MAEKIEIPKNIWEIIDFHSFAYGKAQQEGFNQSVFCDIYKHGITSPIEQAMYSALRYIQMIHGIQAETPEYDSAGKPYTSGIRITPQFEIDKFRVDFLVEYFGRQSYKAVIVECDSQEFHDRSERERRYEKARDRFLQKNNYKVFRYTGAEVLKDSMNIAAEVVSFVTGLTLDDGIIE